MKLLAAKNTIAARRRNARFVLAAVWLVACGLLLSTVEGADKRPDNVFAYPPTLPASMQRVVLLPLASAGQDADLAAGCEALQPILMEELVRTKKFEVVAADAAVVRGGSGQPTWTGAEELPADFFGSLKREYGCDGVLFSELTVYRVYGPPVIGLRLKLVDARSREILWATDQVFDASDEAVAKSAWRFLLIRDKSLVEDEGRWQILSSPRQFGRYATAMALTTLPSR